MYIHMCVCCGKNNKNVKIYVNYAGYTCKQADRATR